MKEKIGTCIPVILLVVILIWGIFSSLLSEKATVEEVKTEATAKTAQETAELTSVVWYNEPHRKLYSPSGDTVYVGDNDADKYEEGGWTEKPPELEGLEALKSSINDYAVSRSGEWGVYVKILKTNEYLAINEKDYSSASLIKLFTAAAVYNELEAGTLNADDELNSNLKLMICESDNHACNYLTRRLGNGDAAKGFEVENRNTESLGCTYTTHNSEIVDGGRITSLGFNKTSPRDCGIVLEGVYRGTLVSSTASASMLELLLHQTRTWKIPASLPEGTQTANKTGETDTTEGDAAIVYSPACNYIICVIGNGNVSGGVNTIQTISQMTYDYFNAQT